MYSPIRRNTKKQAKHKRFLQKNCLRQVQENRQIIIKEEGSEEEDEKTRELFGLSGVINVTLPRIIQVGGLSQDIAGNYIFATVNNG